jgi:HlyD family type I secretion membrane fusion protein
MTFPEDLKSYGEERYIKEVWNAQVHQMQVRLAALEGQRQVIKEKIAQLEHQIVGLEAQAQAFGAQVLSVKDELSSLLPLLEKGLVARPRVLQLERTAAGLDGQIADAKANIAKARQAIAEQVQQSAQLDNDRMTDLAKDLRDTQAKLLEVIPKLMHAQSVLQRIEIRSPYTGRVVGLSIFSVGGVINRGDKIMDVVPDRESLVVEAQVAVEDISDVHPDMRAEVHLTAYKQRTTPIVHGDVFQVSADRLTDSKTNNPYYHRVSTS